MDTLSICLGLNLSASRMAWERERESKHTLPCVYTLVSPTMCNMLWQTIPQLLIASCLLLHFAIEHMQTQTHTYAYKSTHTMRRTHWIRTPTSHTRTHSAKVLHALLELCVCVPAVPTYIYVCVCVCVCSFVCVYVSLHK